MGENSVLGGGGMGPADVAAVMRGNMGYGNGYGDGWGGGCWWIVLLFIAMIWGGNGMWGNNGFQNAIGYENLATSNCETKMLISETAANQRYESAMQNNAVIQAIREEGNATRQMYQQDKIDSLQQKVQTLEMQNAMAGVVRYPMSTAYNAGYNPFCNCGQNYGCCGMAA